MYEKVLNFDNQQGNENEYHNELHILPVRKDKRKEVYRVYFCIVNYMDKRILLYLMEMWIGTAILESSMESISSK